MSVVGLDEDAVASWITGLGVGALAPLSFERIGSGQSNLTFAVRDSGAATGCYVGRRSGSCWRPRTTSAASTASWPRCREPVSRCRKCLV